MLNGRAGFSAPAVSVVNAASAATAMGLAEVFYHFHSFTLELFGFLLTWFALRTALGFVGVGRTTRRGQQL